MKNWKKALAFTSAVAVLMTVTTSLNLSVNAVTDATYEFEDGTLTGATSMTADKDGNEVAHSGSGLVFLMDGGETATVTVTVPETGMYNLTIATYTPYGDKTHSLLVNGVDQGQISFVENKEGFTETALGMYKLTEGENTITVKSSWGWTYLDYIKVTDAEFPELNVTKTLADDKATDETKRLMSYLVDNYGEHILSGQQEIYKYGPHDFEYEFEYINNLTGEYPAIRAFDYLNECNPLYGSEDGTTDRMIDWAKNKNGIITASWHITVPKQFESYKIGDSVDWSNATYVPKDTDFDPSKILEDGSKEQEYYMLCLEKLASSIQKLQDENIPIILRPLHEAEGSGGESGSWFWWGKSGSAVYKELWKLTYNTLTEDYGLHNIIWEWNSYAYSTSKDWYPGDEYVDIVAYDKYNCTDWSTGNAVLVHNDSAISGTFYNLVDMYDGKKMVAMSENDSVPTLENLTSEKAGWLYFCPWYDGGSDNINFLSNPIFNKAEDLKELYQSDYCITLDELPVDLYTAYPLDDTEPPTETTTQTTETSVSIIENATINGTITSIDGDTITVEFENAINVVYDTTADYFQAEGTFVVGDTVSVTVSGDVIDEEILQNPISVIFDGSQTTTPSETTVTTDNTDITTNSDSSETTQEIIGDTLLGDVNCDGSVKSNDLLMLKKSLLGLMDIEEGSQSFINADITQDGSIKTNDLLALKKILLGLYD